jgi:hypothetical protein
MNRACRRATVGEAEAGGQRKEQRRRQRQVQEVAFAGERRVVYRGESRMREQDAGHHERRTNRVGGAAQRPVQRQATASHRERLQRQQQHPGRADHCVGVRVAIDRRERPRKIQRPERADGQNQQQRGDQRHRQRDRCAAPRRRCGHRGNQLACGVRHAGSGQGRRTLPRALPVRQWPWRVAARLWPR